jgi:hypothetical protein
MFFMATVSNSERNESVCYAVLYFELETSRTRHTNKSLAKSTEVILQDQALLDT